MRVLGIDEAGKGPVIGPMVVCGVMCEEGKVEMLREVGVRDSKRLNPSERERLVDVIRKLCSVHVVKVPPDVIDKSNVNELLRECYASIIRRLDPDVVYVDSPDVKPERLRRYLESLTGKRVVSSHKADERYTIVAAASIVAKVERDREIERLKRVYGDFGSGYAGDPKTIDFLKRCIKEGRIPPIVRKKWRTVSRLCQLGLSDFEKKV